MRKFKRLLMAILFLPAVNLFFACDTPVGLGSVVNTEKPVIKIPDAGVSRPGSFLHGGINIIYLEVEQKFGIQAVYMNYWWFTEENGVKQKHERTIQAKYDTASGRYYVEINSFEMPDGPIWAQVIAVDLSGNTTTTTEIVYTVKNTPPEVEMTIPKIKGDEFDDPALNARLKGEPLYQGNDIMGIAKDLLGIEAGYPQIMIWRDGDAFDSDDAPLSDRRKWGVWRIATDDKMKPLAEDGLKALQFRWPMVELMENAPNVWQLPQNSGSYKELESGQYRFKLRVKDKNGTVNVYPNRTNYNIAITDTVNQAQYMQIELAATDNPVIRWIPKPPPQYYNGAGTLEATVTITCGNTIDTGKVRAWVSDSKLQAISPASAGYVKRIGSTNEYEISIPGADIETVSGEMMLYVEAEDVRQNAGASSRGFIMDVDPPKLDFIEPMKMGGFIDPNPNVKPPEGLQKTSTVFIRGTTSDDTSRVVAVYYALGKTETDNPSLGLSLNNNTGWLPTGLGTYPRNYHDYGPGGFEIKIEWSGGLSSWTLRLDDISRLCDGAAAGNGNYYVRDYNSAKNLWLVPLKLKVVDFAGNINICSAQLIADPDADRPTVSITSHKSMQIVGGPVRISGVAIDNEWIDSVEIRITRQSDTDCGSNKAPSEVITKLIPGHDNGFVKANITGGKGATVNWYFDINDDPALPSLDPVKGNGAETREVKIEVRSQDASMYEQNVPKNYSKETAELFLVFDLSVPVIEEKMILRGKPSDYSNIETAAWEILGPNTVAREFVTLRAKVSDDSGITRINLRGQEKTAFADIINSTVKNDINPWVVPKNPTANGLYREYDVYIPLNTNQVGTATQYGSIFENKAGTYDINIQVVDNTLPSAYIAFDNFSLRLDNYYPMASFSGNVNAIGSYNIRGEVWDSGAGINIGEASYVVVYFTRNGDLVSLNEENGHTPASVSQKVKTGRKAKSPHSDNPFALISEGTETTLVNFPNVWTNGVLGTTASGIVINKTGNDSGGYQTFDLETGYKAWSVNFDSTRLKAGPVTLNYAAFDSVGNASHYSQDVYIANDRPIITNISLGADINKDGSVALDEYVDYSSANYPYILTGTELNTGFRVRGDLFSLKLDAANGNGIKYYRVSHVNRNSNAVSASSITRGNVYTIKELGSNVAWINYGVFGTPVIGATFVATHSHSELAAFGINTGIGGEVYTYIASGDQNKTAKPPASQNSGAPLTNAPVEFTANSFGPGLIEDSIKTPDIQYDKYFLIKIYDSTVNGNHPLTLAPAVEADQLSHAAVIKAAVDNKDDVRPKVFVEPFFWNDSQNNSLYSGSKLNGHIELEDDLPAVFNQSSGIDDRDPKVSGKVSFRGTVLDNNTIGVIRFSIGNFQGGAVVTAAVFDNGSWTVNSGTESSFKINGWRFNVSGLPNQEEHRASWQLDFDSSFISGAARADNILTVSAEDKAGNLCNSGSFAQTTLAAKTAYYRFDAVPYIAEVKTKLSDAYSSVPSAFNRSALGGYPVREDEVIEIKGFNLDGQNTSVKVNGTALTGVAPFEADPNNARFHITADIGTQAKSGELEVAVNGVSSINNKNGNDAVYNQEPNGLNNNILNDNRRLYVWNTGYLLDNRTALNPFMRMDKNANWYLSYGYFRDTGSTGGELWVVKNNTALKIEHYYNRYVNTTVAFDEAGDWYSAATNLAGTGYPSFTFYARDANTGTTHGNAGANRRVIMRIENNNLYDGDRAKIPRIFAQNSGGRTTPAASNTTAADNNATRIFFSYYDNNSSDNPVLFHYGTIGRNLSTSGYAGGDLAASNTPTGANIGNRHPAAQEVANNSQVHKGSMYTAVGALSNGLPVIAWYDRTKQRLIFSYGSAVPAANAFNDPSAFVRTSTTDWQNNARIVHEGMGTHVDMAIDENDNIHLAYYDVINGGLYYARIPVTGSGSAARPDSGGANNLSVAANIQKAKVDTFLSAGTKLMISIRREDGKDVPYITYWHASFAETRNSIRVAWLLPDKSGNMTVRNGTDASDKFTGEWEVMTVPAGKNSSGSDSIPKAEEFICHGVPQAAAWTIPGGASTLKYNTAMNKTMLIAYMTTNWYEGAILKDDMTVNSWWKK